MPSCRFPQLLIERRQDDLMTNPFLPRQSRRELDSVVATQALLPGQPLGSLHHGFRGRPQLVFVESQHLEAACSPGGFFGVVLGLGARRR